MTALLPHLRRARAQSVLASILLALVVFAPAAFAAAADSAKADSAAKDTPWKVEDEHGPSEMVSFTTDEGTWLALDVSPDGRQIVFAMLGDLYLLPIGGGEAKRITSGAGYDNEPRYSPDGKRIAFSSDRGGLLNVWICDLDGTNAIQVSTEKKFTVSAPAWSADGQYLIARKRITDRSSLGSVELWMWHLKGGDGVQVTKKEDQPDAADVDCAKDGRFIYYSARDARYAYDRDVYEGIWQVKRLDRVTGEAIPLTGEYGGGACPRIAPDGRSMSFVRRVDAKTRMEVMDLATGKTRMLADGLTRDNQESFCQYGVFPGYAWTPDGRAIVATADGKIWRFDAMTGARTAIPFSAKVEQRVHRALRYEHDIAPDQVRARVLRWPVESPDGSRVVFSTLGYLYSASTSGGAPRRLTTATDFEYAPAFSPDGRWLAFVTWNDTEGGHVWKMPAGGGRAVRLTRIPAQYANPAFSADGRRVVFVKGSGATFRGQDPGNELWDEIRWVDAAGGEDHRISGTRPGVGFARMTRPTFSPDGERVYFAEEKPSGKPGVPSNTVLVSMKLDGTDRRGHLSIKYADEAVVSPDGQWVAFGSLSNIYLVALPVTGSETVEVGLEGGPLPMRQLSKEGGWWVSWANRGRTVVWASGPDVHRITLDQAIPARKPEAAEKKDGEKAEAKKKSDLPESDVLTIDLRVPRARPRGVTAYTGARLVTMRGDEVIERGTILVENDRIKAVGPEAQVEIPAEARTVDLYGMTVIPGMIDEHAHLHYSAQDILPQRPWKYLANLAYGVTTTHDPSATSFECFEQGAMVEAGLIDGPRSFSTGGVLYGADGNGRAIVNNLDDARAHVRRQKKLGALSVKSYMQPARNQRQWLIEAAREESIMVMPEGGGDFDADMGMILDGHTTIEHALPYVPLYKDAVTLLAKSGTAYTPTLLVAYGGPSGDKYYHQHYELFRDPRLLRHIPAEVIVPLTRIRSLLVPDEDWHVFDVAASAKKVVEAGGRVCLGGHGQMQGLGPHWEIWAFVKGGMTPLQALRVATLMPAEALGMDRQIGSIAPGKLADSVVLDRNPLEKIENTDSVSLVVKNGKAYRPEALALKQ
jgi:Tol biopolymer transport system component/imidazolonepropionase-like amidohydrolase